MAQPTVDQVWRDPDFQGLPMEEKRKVLTSIDSDFAGLAAPEQDKVLGVHTVISAPDNAKLQNVADSISGVMNKIDHPGGTSNAIEMAPQGNELFNKMGGAISDKLGRTYPNHTTLDAIPGTVVSLLNPENFLSPAKGVSAQVLKPAPELPVNEAASGVPFTRAEISQNPNALGVQGIVQGSPTGGLALNPFKEAQAAKLSEFQNALQSKLGTSESPDITGNLMRDHVIREQATNKALSDSLYSNVPKDAQLPINELSSTFQKLGDELPKQFGDLVRKYTKIGNTLPDVAESEGATTVSKASPTPSAANTSTTVDLHSLMSLRSRLTALQSEGGINGMYATVLKKALNNDITNMAQMDQSPLGQLMGNSAKDSLSQATNYYREMAALRDHPVTKALQNAKISDLPDIAFKGGRVEDLQVAKAALGDVGFQAAQKQFFSDLLNQKNIGKALSKYEPEFLNQALSSDQLQALQTMDALKQRAMSASRVEPLAGSSKMNMWLALLHGMATNPLKTLVTGGVLPYGAAQMLMNTAGKSVGMGPALTTGAMAATGLAQTPAPNNPLSVLRRYVQQQKGSAQQ